ncbi:bifunctional indole-3-glycerol-phosphate synthase TrpC/phosphoribosylanthranilate isomerase TrpF [Shewanella sp. A32]|uniref:bifunctional indole-3-glycerol-phosphate synthase TrpC/phosphoribosylanthranilate isomerase TrpF n=1 Tax=Shewanella sp. A32 TaxID=3031327 RepID=UPI0023BA250D|nr:bifunctional indole-3-glycerol-phosphate synthase TrpC/phosphoribosylanthranilate isomerase TrpF [Shewanella sp. A32]MDF0535100.1 bifunctional indole-3-glycerol-phosphate synthase TrpC/phosphoribosylanthranilate isomerase TrpF [Shewanella sp. A32]
MSNVLTRIVDTKTEHIASLKKRFPEESLRPQISHRSLYRALSGPKASFILECKKASPSKGLIRDDFDPQSIAATYSHYASAVSVLTDEQFFQGDFDFIPLVRSQVDQPILCKDFFISPYQIKLAAHQGADAILLMLSVLDNVQYRQLAAEAAKYRLDILTEVSNEEELHRAIALNAPLVGINNRNLRDLTTNIVNTERLAPKLPKDMLVISESGIYTHADVRQLAPLVNGFLVGSSLMAEDDLDLACRKLIFGHNKVCGITRSSDLHAAADAGAVYGGLIFAPQSSRKVTLEQALELAKSNREQKQHLLLVGVFVDAPTSEIVTVAVALKLDAVQLHGKEDDTALARLREGLDNAGMSATEIWKAIPVNAEGETAAISIPAHADRVLYDSKTGASFGGTGKAFNWQQPLPSKADAMLAGGLGPDNAAEAAEQGFFGLDFNSGVEVAPGIKDSDKIYDVLAAVRA